MPWTTSDPPPPARNWTDSEKEKCVRAANAALDDGASEEEAIFACIAAAGKSEDGTVAWGTNTSGELRVSTPEAQAASASSTALEYKAFPEWKFIDGQVGGFDGYASLFGVLDDGGDIVERGAFAGTIDQFLKNGFIALGHDWNGLPIGYPVDVHEDERGLYLRAEYHSTPEAQHARRVAQERMGRGMSVGLSIGYLPEVAGSSPEGHRLLRKVGLFEVSQVNVPMLRPAGLSAVKSQPVPYQEHGDRVLATVSEYVARSHDRLDLLRKEGRRFSEDTRRRHRAIREALLAVLADLDAMDPDDEQPKAQQPSPQPMSDVALLHARFLDFEARHRELFS